MRWLWEIDRLLSGLFGQDPTCQEGESFLLQAVIVDIKRTELRHGHRISAPKEEEKMKGRHNAEKKSGWEFSTKVSYLTT